MRPTTLADRYCGPPGQPCPPVVVYRLEGGGHGWPGGPRYLPARVVGLIPRHLDATGILLNNPGYS